MEAIEKGEKECWEMPHDETLRIMRQMDHLWKARDAIPHRTLFLIWY